MNKWKAVLMLLRARLPSCIQLLVFGRLHQASSHSMHCLDRSLLAQVIRCRDRESVLSLKSTPNMPLVVRLQQSQVRSLFTTLSTCDRSVFRRHKAESGRNLILTHKHTKICQNVQPKHCIHRKLDISSSPVASASQRNDISSGADDASAPNSRAPQSEAQPSTSYPIPVIQPRGSSKPSTSGRTSASVQQFPVVSEGRRSASWEYKQRADKRSLWGTFIKVLLALALSCA